MGRETRREPERELTDDDRVTIALARETLKSYGLDTHPDAPEPLSELGYEQRMARGRAADLAVQAMVSGYADGASIAGLAQEIYAFIWEGKV